MGSKMKGKFMRTRNALMAGIVALGLGVGAQASTIFVSLKATPTADPLVFDIGVYARTDQGPTSAGGDGGISGFQFDILSTGDSKIAPVPWDPLGRPLPR